MLAIRMQRTGRKGHAMFRVIVQESRLTPTSGKVVARLGSYDPHSKAIILDKEKAAFYLEHGAQPSDRVVRLLKNEGVKLPGWVKLPADKERVVRNADKRRSTRPAEPAAEAPAPDTAAEEVAPVEEAVEAAQSSDEAELEAAPVAEAETETEAPADEAPQEAATEAPESAEKPDEKPTEDAGTEPAEEA